MKQLEDIKLNINEDLDIGLVLHTLYKCGYSIEVVCQVAPADNKIAHMHIAISGSESRAVFYCDIENFPIYILKSIEKIGKPGDIEESYINIDYNRVEG